MNNIFWLSVNSMYEVWCTGKMCMSIYVIACELSVHELSRNHLVRLVFVRSNLTLKEEMTHSDSNLSGLNLIIQVKKDELSIGSFLTPL